MHAVIEGFPHTAPVVEGVGRIASAFPPKHPPRRARAGRIAGTVGAFCALISGASENRGEATLAAPDKRRFAFVDLQDVTSTQTGARLRSEQQTVSRPVRGESEVALARDVTAVPAISTTNLITRPATRMVP